MLNSQVPVSGEQKHMFRHLSCQLKLFYQQCLGQRHWWTVTSWSVCVSVCVRMCVFTVCLSLYPPAPEQPGAVTTKTWAYRAFWVAWFPRAQKQLACQTCHWLWTEDSEICCVFNCSGFLSALNFCLGQISSVYQRLPFSDLKRYSVNTMQLYINAPHSMRLCTYFFILGFK